MKEFKIYDTIGNIARVIPMNEIIKQLEEKLGALDITPVDVIEQLKKENMFKLADDFARMSVVKAKHDGLIDNYSDERVRKFSERYCNSTFIDISQVNNDYCNAIHNIQIMLNEHLDKFQYDKRKTYPLTYVTKRFEFSAAHQIYGYNGLCANVHGHTWFIEVTLVDNVYEDSGFVLDFKELKALVNDSILKELDHHMINEVAQPLLRPTAETLLPYIYFKLFLDNKSETFLPIHNIRLYESPDSWADLRFSDLMKSNFNYIHLYLKYLATVE